MDVLLAASLLLIGAGVTLLLFGRWRAALRFAHGVPGARGRISLTTVGLAAAVLGALLLVAFVGIGLTMQPAGAA